MSRSTRRESHVLKLVHPGGFVELHTNSIMACEIMKKNPRHCVTRPDIFKFPWIVISPESILRPGNVFFIVPCHTIRHLLKSTHSNTNTNTVIKDNIDQQDHHQRYPNKIKSLKKQSFNGVGNKDLSFVTNDSVQIINPVLKKSCLKKDMKQGGRSRNLKVRFDFTATKISVF